VIVSKWSSPDAKLNGGDNSEACSDRGLLQLRQCRRHLWAQSLQDGVHLPTPRGNTRSRTCWWVGDAITVARQLAPEGDCLIGENGTLLGIVLGSDLDDAPRKGSGGAAVASVARREALNTLPYLNPDQSADAVLHRLGQFNLGVLPVVDRRDITQVLGQVTPLEAYRNASA